MFANESSWSATSDARQAIPHLISEICSFGYATPVGEQHGDAGRALLLRPREPVSIRAFPGENVEGC
jgi:hypothetical protein